MADPTDPWRAVVEVTAAADEARAAHPELVARLEAAGSRFGAADHGVSGLLDDVDRRTVIDVEAPVESSRPVVPQLKTSVRKAVAFVARHLAQQTTVLVSGLSAAVRLLEERVQALEADGHEAVIPLVPDVRARVATVLGSLESRSEGLRRDVGSLAELHTLPRADAALVVAYRLLDVGPISARFARLDRLVGGVAPGGRLAIVTVSPVSWHEIADVVTRDLGRPGPLHPETWAHLLQQRGGHDVGVHEATGAHVVAARW